MTNYYKLYITDSKGHTSKDKYKTSVEVRNVISNLKDGRYLVIKRLKQSTDVPVASGYWNGHKMVILDDRLDVDYRVIGHNVVDASIYQDERE